jgi:type II secretory pathway pseudopilin PulG
MGKGRAAFTLFESLVAVLLVGIAATAFCSALVAGTNQNQAAVQYVVATNLAAALMEEVLAKRFADPDLPLGFVPGPDAGEAPRTGADNVDDYHGLIENAGQLLSCKGTTLAAGSLSKYSRSATVSYVNVPGRDPALGPGFVLVTVEVNYDGVSLVKLTRLISSEERR